MDNPRFTEDLTEIRVEHPIHKNTNYTRMSNPKTIAKHWAGGISKRNFKGEHTGHATDQEAIASWAATWQRRAAMAELAGSTLIVFQVPAHLEVDIVLELERYLQTRCEPCEDLFAFFTRSGYTHIREVPGWGWCGVEKMIYDWAIWYNMTRYGKGGGFFYGTYNEAVEALTAWNGVGDPPGKYLRKV